jgi:hypothetical protein
MFVVFIHVQAYAAKHLLQNAIQYESNGMR